MAPSLAVCTCSPAPSIASPPNFLPPAYHENFSPSPSPFPALPVASHHRLLSKAAIIGGGVAGVVTLAVSAAIISTVASRVGLRCLLQPLLNLFASLASNLTRPCGRLSSLCSTFQGFNPSEGTSSKETGGDNVAPGGGDRDLESYSSDALPKARGAAATAQSLAKSPLQEVVKSQLGIPGQALLIPAMTSDYAESETNKQKESMLRPGNQQLAKVQGYDGSFFSATSNLSDQVSSLKQPADAQLNEASKLKVGADQINNSTNTMAPALSKQSASAGALTWQDKVKLTNMLDEGKSNEMERRLPKLQEPLITDGDEKVLGKASTSTSTNKELANEEESKQDIVSAGRGRFLSIVETSSNRSDLNRGAMDPNLYSAADTGSKSIVAVPEKAITSADKPAWQQPGLDDDKAQGKDMSRTGKGGGAGKQRPTNLGHVSFTCEMSAHRLRFFTSCRSGGTYGVSPPPSYASDTYTNNNTNHYINFDSTTNNGTNDYINYTHRKNGNFYNSKSAPFPKYIDNNTLLANSAPFPKYIDNNTLLGNSARFPKYIDNDRYLAATTSSRDLTATRSSYEEQQPSQSLAATTSSRDLTATRSSYEEQQPSQSNIVERDP